MTAITVQTICIICYNAQKHSAIFQQGALAASNKPRDLFGVFFEKALLSAETPALSSREVFLPEEHRDDDSATVILLLA